MKSPGGDTSLTVGTAGAGDPGAPGAPGAPGVPGAPGAPGATGVISIFFGDNYSELLQITSSITWRPPNHLKVSI